MKKLRRKEEVLKGEEEFLIKKIESMEKQRGLFIENLTDVPVQGGGIVSLGLGGPTP